MPRNREEQFRQHYDQDVARTGAVGQALMGQFQGGISEDPRAAYERSIGASIDRFKERFGEGLQNLRGQQVGMGRLTTGFAQDDEDMLFRNLSRDAAREMSDRALQAEGLNLNRLGMMGSMGDRLSERAMSARGGEYHTLRAQRLQDAAERRRRRGSLLGVGIGALGTILGGPVGGVIAGAISDRVTNR